MVRGVFTGSNSYLRTYSPSFGRVDGHLLLRTFGITARRLRHRLLHLVDDLAAGRLDVARFTKLANQSIRTEFGIAYSLGALSISPFHTLTIRDIRAIDSELTSERRFLRSFAQDIAGGKYVLDPVQRAGLYLQALRGMFEYGRINALPSGPYTWELGDTDHCIECISASLNGPYQRSRFEHLGLPVLPGVPGSGDVCRGLTRCGCFIRLEGLPIPNENMQEEIRNVLAEVLHDTS